MMYFYVYSNLCQIRFTVFIVLSASLVYALIITPVVGSIFGQRRSTLVSGESEQTGEVLFDRISEFYSKALKKFVKNYIMQYENAKDMPIHFIGSIAFYLIDDLTAVLNKYEMKIGNVLRRPIDGLIAYHILNK